MRIPPVAIALIVALAACSSSGSGKKSATSTATSTTATTVAPRTATTTDPDIYAADRPNQLSPVVAGFRSLVYVPNSESDTVDVIDPSTFKIVEHFAVGHLPQHVVPSWDLKTLYVTNDLGDTLTPIDARTGVPSARIPATDPYNMYFTTDGQHAIVVAERFQRLDFRDPHTFKLQKALNVNCKGVDHLDFSADGRYLIASCEFSGKVLKVDVAAQRVIGTVLLNGGNAKPQDVKLDPTGHVFYIADMNRGGVYTVDGDRFAVTGFIPTGRGAHGLYVSRDSKTLYVTNRGEGTISLLDLATNRISTTWHIPGGSPDMGGVSADGKYLWITGRYNAEVYVIDTATGAVVHRIPVGRGPHGLCVYPQPGRYSLGHTGVFR